MATDLHDEINLRRLVRRLEKSASDSQWTTASDDTWIKVQGTLQKVKYARKLLGNVELEDVDPTPKSMQRYNDFRTKLDRIDAFMKELDKRTAPKQTRPAPLLPHIPTPPDEPEPAPAQQRASPPEAISVSGDEDSTSAALVTDNLLFSAGDGARSSFSSSVSPPLTTLLPASFPSATKSTTTALEPRMQGSTASQREMGEQLSLMATQLKRNALYFSDLMEKDQRVIEETEVKLDGNFGYMQKTQTRMKGLREKTGSSTCMRMLIILVVTFLFMFMVSLIRFSGR
ncbi:hypothetical protein C8F04DRAFT_1110124 [Mycena alexandri]|uniref:Vesicle transport protein n=1 Tax=Mycena alexandri TaxID=1745969 RepID=A0AAD6X1R7_9AGAR|nr:hypothetical protein C8F04DRAFT_1110124 [Mycena alexandri]